MLNSNEYSIKQLDLANQKIRYILEIKKKYKVLKNINFFILLYFINLENFKTE